MTPPLSTIIVGPVIGVVVVIVDIIVIIKCNLMTRIFTNKGASEVVEIKVER